MEHICLETVHPSWKPFFTQEILDLLQSIDSAMTTPCNPAPAAVLRFAQQPLDEVKVLILGQDTYPAPGVATGRSFEVGGLTSWHTPFQQISLKHIIQNIYGVHTGNSPYTKFSLIQKEMKSGGFPIAPPHILFQNWAEQGVLLLNAALSCQVGAPGSHSQLWEPFTAKLLPFIAQARPELHVFLWGRYAQAFAHCFPTQTVHSSRHPMMCSPKYEDDFLKFQGFLATRDLISWTGNPL